MPSALRASFERQEYLVWRTVDQRIDWFELVDGTYRPLPADDRSNVFPGLAPCPPTISPACGPRRRKPWPDRAADPSVPQRAAQILEFGDQLADDQTGAGLFLGAVLAGQALSGAVDGEALVVEQLADAAH